MLNILINAYAVSPSWGSEPGMGWNWIIHLAKHCRLYVITEGEWKEEIVAAMLTLPQAGNISWYFIPSSEKVRRMCWNQGDWRFYWYYRKWQKLALVKAEEILKSSHIDVIHQLNMIGYREPGYLWKIKYKPYIWGPIGGMELVPIQYFKNGGIALNLVSRMKNLLNWLQVRRSRRVRLAIQRADVLISAVQGVKETILKIHHQESIVIPETGCLVREAKLNFKSLEFGKPMKLLWVGKFDARKQLGIALDTVSILSSKIPVELHICGTGTDDQVVHYKQMAKRLGIQDNVVWYGKVPMNVVHEVREQSHMFFFTSVMDATSTVLVEAIQSCLPIVCFDTCGMSSIVDDSIGTKIPLTTPEQSVKDFAGAILEYYRNGDLLQKKSMACKEKMVDLSWETKAKIMVELYKSLAGISNFEIQQNLYD